MKFFENKRTQSRRELYICGIRVLTRERGKAAAARRHKESLAAQEILLNQTRTYLATEADLAALPPAKQELPGNTVWQLWFQGEENAPALIRKCLSSVRQHTSGRPYVLLTNENLHDYLDIPDYIMQKYRAGNIGHAHFSDVVRLLLLAQYGGTWIDATVLLTAPLPDEVEQAPFFVFKSTDFCLYPRLPRSTKWLREIQPLGNPYHCCSNWFIHASRGNRLVCIILASLLRHWKQEDSAINYFVMHLLITLAVLSDDDCRRIFESMPTMGNHYPHILQHMLDEDFNPDIFTEVSAVSFAHKLTHRHNEEAFSPRSYYHKLLSDN